MTNVSPRALAAGMATVMATVSMSSATKPSPAQIRKKMAGADGTGAVLVMIKVDASEASSRAVGRISPLIAEAA